MERDLRVAAALQVAYPLRIDERNVLALSDEQPKNEVRMEIAGLKEAHTAAAIEIPEQVHLPLSEEGLIGIVEATQILDEVLFSLVQFHQIGRASWRERV